MLYNLTIHKPDIGVGVSSLHAKDHPNLVMPDKIRYLFLRNSVFATITNKVASIKLENIFLLLALIFGILFAFFTAPFQAPDEYIHFYRAYMVSQGDLMGWESTLPKSVLDFSRMVNQDLPGNDQNKQSKKALAAEFSRSFQFTPQEKVDVSNISVYSFVPYLPDALAIFLSRLMLLPPIASFFLARLANLVVWIFLVHLAIRVTPLHPRLFVALALMPMTLFMAASCSPDSFTNGISFLWIAFIFRSAKKVESGLKSSDWIIMVLLVVLLALSKSIYVLLAGLILLLPFRRKDMWRSYLTGSLVVIGIALLVGILWLQFSISYVNAQSTGSYGMPSIRELNNLIANPLVYARIFMRSFQDDFFQQARMLIGVLGWLDTPMQSWVYPVYYLLLLFIVVFEPHPMLSLKTMEKTWMLMLGLFGYLILMVTLFNPQVDLGNGRIRLSQGRYLIPFSPLFFLLFSQKKWSFPEKSPIWVITIAIHILVLILAARALLWRYYAI